MWGTTKNFIDDPETWSYKNALMAAHHIYICYELIGKPKVEIDKKIKTLAFDVDNDFT